MQDTLTHEKFQALIDQNLKLKVDDVALDAKVTEVTLHTKNKDAERYPFSVVMVTDSSENHGQQMYSMQHADLGECDIFLVPLGPVGDGMSYEAVFT